MWRKASSMVQGPKYGAPDLSTFGASANINLTEMQWKDLALKEFVVNFSKYEFFSFWCELIFWGELTQNIRDFR